MRTVRRMHPMLTILAVLAIAMSVAMASIRPVHAADDPACARGDRAPACGG